MAKIPQLKLISHKLCPYVQRSIITLLEKQIPHEREYIDLAHKPDWFLEVSPLGKVPLLLVEAEVLFESAVICEYLDEITPGSLHPEEALAKAKHRSWIEFGSNILTNVAGFYSAPDQASFMTKQQALTDAFQLLEQHLLRSPYFSGEAFSLIDAVYGPIFRYFDVFEQYQDFGFFSHTPRVKAWQTALRQRPSVQQAVSADYPILLTQFLQQKDSYLSRLI